MQSEIWGREILQASQSTSGLKAQNSPVDTGIGRVRGFVVAQAREKSEWAGQSAGHSFGEWRQEVKRRSTVVNPADGTILDRKQA